MCFYVAHKYYTLIKVQKPVEWSKEDEINRDLIYNALNQVYDMKHNKELSRWFNSLIGRCLLQPQQEWSEEDERIRQDIENLIHFALEDGSTVSPVAHTTKEKAISWIQSLRNQILCTMERSDFYADYYKLDKWNGKFNG